MNKRYVLTCDYGLDDAAATAFVLDKRDRSDEVDVVPIGGNSSVEVAYRNARTLLAAYEGNTDGVRVVDTRSVAQPFANLPSIHGEDGMGDLFSPASVSPVPEITLDEWLGESGEYVLVSLGPCTVPVIMTEARVPEFTLIMGGCVHAEPNFHGYEFNHYLDIPAFNRLAAAENCAVATLDSCRVPRFNLAGKSIEGDGLTATLLKRSRELAAARHPDNCYVYDYIAAHFLFEPARVEIAVDREKNALKQVVFNE